MIAKEQYKKVRIHITTYNKPKKQYLIEMNKTKTRSSDDSRFICSICLNSNKIQEERHVECDRRKSKSCPMCNGSEISNDVYVRRTKVESNDHIGTIHKPKINVDQGLNLLTEVLTVFQNQKEKSLKEVNEGNSRMIMLRDACVAADIGTKKPKLSISKVFQVSIEGASPETGKFCVVNSSQPKVASNSQCSINLIKQKSSSIPQMKMEELKNSLKEKTKTNKDAIDEVNRMFATVKRDEDFDEINRPQIRSGPRVLPVVKTTIKQTQRQYDEKQICRCCQTKQTNYHMSSGDSLAKIDRCEKGVNVDCSNKNHKRVVQKDMTGCEYCRKS